MSTYMRTRANSARTLRLQLRPCTIWTLLDYDSAQQTNCQEKVGSALFQEVATADFMNGSSVALNRESVKKPRGLLAKACAVANILDEILSLFSGNEDLNIIGNDALNTHLTVLANTIKQEPSGEHSADCGNQ
ncbi:hypothetical protein BJV82DRAFT_605820 [Fennellomyces sp. T-0311]|nr:hypothetical protein BJV82DRAFT_605820 [Fennellomyces sp. T-0311]